MREVNTVTITGTLTDLELFQAGEEFPILRGTIAGDAPEGDASNTFYLPFQIRGRYAEVMEGILQQGAHVHALGHLETHTWEKDGANRTSTMLVVDIVKLLPATQRTATDSRGLARLATGANAAQLSGNLVRDPVTHKFRNQNVTRFTLAVKSGYGDRERTHFIEVATSDPAAAGLRKGDSALAVGAVERASWERDGEKVRLTRISAQSVTALERPQRTAQAA